MYLLVFIYSVLASCPKYSCGANPIMAAILWPFRESNDNMSLLVDIALLGMTREGSHPHCRPMSKHISTSHSCGIPTVTSPPADSTLITVACKKTRTMKMKPQDNGAARAFTSRDADHKIYDIHFMPNGPPEGWNSMETFFLGWKHFLCPPNLRPKIYADWTIRVHKTHFKRHYS